MDIQEESSDRYLRVSDQQYSQEELKSFATSFVSNGYSSAGGEASKDEKYIDDGRRVTTKTENEINCMTYIKGIGDEISLLLADLVSPIISGRRKAYNGIVNHVCKGSTILS